MKDIFDSVFNGKGLDGWMTEMRQEAEKEQIAKEISELVEKNPEYIHKCGVIDSMLVSLRNKINELNKMKTEVRVDIANRIISSCGDKYKGYTFEIPPNSATIFGTQSGPVLKKENKE